jgi:hypothetical protein
LQDNSTFERPLHGTFTLASGITTALNITLAQGSPDVLR